jgi:hypothetical protein
MAPLISTLIAFFTGPPGGSDRCPVCHQAVAAEEPRVRLPGGGYVHRGCSTYSMRSRANGFRTATD